ncbi:MAG: carbohydrate ABC transporter permease [Lachnospiraceae bacterium]|nr:carbohydrate ABC transporter permease [Lachnospiraceae bacterium]
MKAEKKQKKSTKRDSSFGLIIYKSTVGDRIFNAVNIFLFAVFMIICVFPFYYLFINTISDNELVNRGMITFIPKGIHLSNYKALLNISDLGKSFIVTISRTILGTALMVAVSGFAGYIVTKQHMWKRKLWYRMIVITMYFNAGLIPWYLNMLMLGLTNSFWAYIIPGIVAPYNIILVKTYVESISQELEESALLDGATTMQVFTKIIWPLSKPILATIAIFGAVGNWNSFQDSLLLMNSNPGLYTLQHRLYIYLNQATSISSEIDAAMVDRIAAGMLSNRIIKYSISMVTVIPILCVYPFMQRYFVKGIMLGAVKG